MYGGETWSGACLKRSGSFAVPNIKTDTCSLESSKPKGKRIYIYMNQFTPRLNKATQIDASDLEMNEKAINVQL